MSNPRNATTADAATGAERTAGQGAYIMMHIPADDRGQDQHQGFPYEVCIKLADAETRHQIVAGFRTLPEAKSRRDHINGVDVRPEPEAPVTMATGFVAIAKAEGRDQ